MPSLQNDEFLSSPGNEHNQMKPEDFIAMVEQDLAYLDGSAIVQWQQFLKIILHSTFTNNKNQ